MIPVDPETLIHGNTLFGRVVSDGWIHGRGASDTKGAIAAQIYAAAAVKKAGAPHKGIIVTVVVEESPAMCGA